MPDPATQTEPILDPDLPIIDTHHHLWDKRSTTDLTAAPRHAFDQVFRETPYYMLEQLLADAGSGHNVRATVHVNCHSMYRAAGPAPLRCVGETDFVNGVAAMSASGLYGDTQVAAGIVGAADLMLGDAVSEVLEAHLRASELRFRGVRYTVSWDADPTVLGGIHQVGPGLYAAPKFREGFARLAAYGLTFDAWLLEPQLPDLIDLARAFPDAPIVLDHIGSPLGVGAYAGRLGERFGVWRDNIRRLAQSPKVMIKLGGLGMPLLGSASFMSTPPASSVQLAAEWGPYIETCIEAFGPDRCMFQSNFPVDLCTATYAILWNTFKRITAGYSRTEKEALFGGTGARFYRLEG